MKYWMNIPKKIGSSILEEIKYIEDQEDIFMTNLLDLLKMASIGKPYTILKSVIHYPVPGMTKEYAIKVWKQQKKRGVTTLSKKEWLRRYGLGE